MEENSWTVTGPQSMDVDGVSHLKVGIVRGRLDIVTHDEAVVRIEVSDVLGDPLAISMTGGRLEIRHNARTAGLVQKPDELGQQQQQQLRGYQHRRPCRR
jgi:penicillin V acylase-like amidase (Ntn superfamily)